MTRIIARLTLLLLFLPPWLHAVAKEATSLEITRSIYEATLRKIDKEAKTTLETCLSDYGKGLEKAMMTIQKRGDLEGLLAARKEKQRFLAEESVPDAPPKDAPTDVVKAQSEYRMQTAKAWQERNRETIDLTNKYARRLDNMKRQLTIDGKIEEAIEAKVEMDRVLSSPAVAAARVGRGPSPRAKEEVVPETITRTAKMVTCSHCNGTGSLVQPCQECGGSGTCSSWGGTGWLPSGLKGSNSKRKCPTCRGAGRCPKCGGSGQARASCPVCQGTGKLSEAEAQLAAASEPAEDEKVLPSGGERDRLIDKEIDDYVNSVSALLGQFKGGNADDADFGEVTEDPLSYTGTVCRSDVFLLQSHPKGVRVGAQLADAKTGGETLIPYSRSVGNKAVLVFRKVGQCGRVAITYGVVNEKNRMLFDIQPL